MFSNTSWNMSPQITTPTTSHSLVEGQGNYVLQSNSDTPRTRELYKGFTIVPISVMRSISVTKEGRKTAGEVLILSDNLASVLDITQKEAEEKELIVEI